MIRIAVLGRAAAVAILFSGAFTVSARAQEVSETQLAAARDAITALNVTDRYDNILPNLAERLKAQFIQASPNFQSQISNVVDEQALALAPRRADLEKEAASIYAKSFSVDELEVDLYLFQHGDRQEALDQPAARQPRIDQGRRNLGKRDFPRPDQPELGKAARHHRRKPDPGAGRRCGSGGSTGRSTRTGKACYSAGTGQARCCACRQTGSSGRHRSGKARRSGCQASSDPGARAEAVMA